MFRFRVLINSLELSPSLRTAVCVAFRRQSIQSSNFSECDTRAIFADRVDGQALKLGLRHASKDLLEIAIELGCGRLIIIVVCHNSHTGLVRGAPPPTIIP